MAKIIAGLATMVLAPAAQAETIGFDGDAAGVAPAGWLWQHRWRLAALVGRGGCRGGQPAQCAETVRLGSFFPGA